MDKIIEVRNLVKKFGKFVAVDGITFSVDRQTCVGLLGPNGAGKTSTVRILECISPPTSGEAFVLGIPASLSARNIRERLGVVPQENDLDVDLTVWQNLTIFAKFFDIPKHIARKRIETLLEFMDLTTKKDCKIEELSSGMKRRVLVARALINEPEILILDEPTTGLDPQMRQIIWQKIGSLKDQGLSIILTTHYMEEAEQLCDVVLIMDMGKILKMGSPKDLVKELVGGEVPVARRPANLEDVFLKLTGRGLNE